jgi:hypothetical protein
MAQFSDVYSYIKLVVPATGRVILDGSSVDPRSYPSVVIRYVVVNDSNTPTSDFIVTCALRKDGVKLENPVSSAKLKLQPKQVVSFEHTVSTSGLVNAQFDASMLADIGNFNTEESETNNKATAMFTVIKQPN